MKHQIQHQTYCSKRYTGSIFPYKRKLMLFLIVVITSSAVAASSTSFVINGLFHEINCIKHSKPMAFVSSLSLSSSQKREKIKNLCSSKTTAQTRNNNKINGIVPRLTLQEYLISLSSSSSTKSKSFKTPVLITDIVSPNETERIAWTLLRCLSNEYVTVQRQQRKGRDHQKNVDKSKNNDGDNHDDSIINDDNDKDETALYDMSLEEAIDEIMDSSHEDAAFAFCEGLLSTSLSLSSSESQNHPHIEKIAKELSWIRDSPFIISSSSSSQEEEDMYKENWFDYFPSGTISDAVVLAGEGATSTLHRDPFEWTGTSFCLEGSKVWRFILPAASANSDDDDDDGVENVDKALKHYRLNSVAWGDDNKDDDENDEKNPEATTLSAGWQSDMSLYKQRSNQVPTAKQLDELFSNDAEAHRRTLELIGVNTTLLEPSEDTLDALGSLMKLRQEKSTSNDENNHNEQEGNKDSVPFVTSIQQAGELLLIPAHCWHQTYALEPSISIASQRCTAEIDGRSVIQHILKKVHNQLQEQHGEEEKEETDVTIPEILQRKSYKEGEGEKVVGALFEYISSISKRR
mmetsp:Transcript_21178/g.31150  ORF Transcript_21178/g.31150 Transcript_21178/m.31150 type:complete len:575 (+) Transcript_21178:103-1827(+)